MSSHVIGGQVWTDGTSVSVYPAAAWTDTTRAPSGSAVTIATVASGTVTFTALAENVRYVAWAAGHGVTFVVKADRSPLVGARSADRQRIDDLEAAVAVKAHRPVNLRDEGGDYTGAVDALGTVAGVLAGNNHLVIPPGTYSVDDVVEVAAYRTLELLPGATLQRRTGTGPVVRLNGANYSRLIGHGTVQALNASPQGIVHVGPAVQTVTANVQRWRVRDVTLVGASATASNLGLNITSSEAAAPTGSAAGSNYLGSAADLDVQQVGVGVKVGEQCNAHNFSNIVLHLIGAYSYHLAGGANGVAENSFYGGFTHAKASGNITVLKLERALFCEFYGVKAEPDAPGVPGSLYYAIDANSARNRIFGFGNFETDPQGTDAGTNNVHRSWRAGDRGPDGVRRGQLEAVRPRQRRHLARRDVDLAVCRGFRPRDPPRFRMCRRSPSTAATSFRSGRSSASARAGRSATGRRRAARRSRTAPWTRRAPCRSRTRGS
jgi:hypothetical protein